jgi:hypothetical protein
MFVMSHDLINYSTKTLEKFINFILFRVKYIFKIHSRRSYHTIKLCIEIIIMHMSFFYIGIVENDMREKNKKFLFFINKKTIRIII